MNPLEAEFFADFLIFFLERNAIALMIAVPAIAYLIFNPPSKWRN